MSRRTLPLSIALAGLIAVGSLGGCSAEAQAPVRPTLPKATAPALAGSTGALNVDDGYVSVGHGDDIVDVYVDALCPYCKLFEALNGDFLLAEAQADNITLRIHPVAILDRLSAGTRYSTRAAAVLAAVAERDPEQLPSFFGALFDAQPGEGTEGLSNDELTDIALSVGAEAPTAERVNELLEWVGRSTQIARSRDLSATAGPLTHVPMVLVNGALFPGNSGDIELFSRFYAEQTP